MDEDPILRALERSTIAQTLKAARASLVEPSRPFTPLDRSLFQQGDASPSRPSSSYSVDQLAFVRDTFGNRPESARSSRSSRSRAFEPIAEEGLPFDEGGYSREGGADVLRVGSPEEAAASSGSEELTPVTASGPSGSPLPPSKNGPARPPRPPAPSGGYPAAAAAAANARDSRGFQGGYPAPGGAPEAPEKSSKRPSSRDSRERRKASGSRKAAEEASPKSQDKEASPASKERRRKISRSPAPSGSSISEIWDAECDALVSKLQALTEAEEVRKKDRSEDSKESKASTAAGFLEISERLWALVSELKAGSSSSSKPEKAAGRLLRAVLGLLDIKDTISQFKLSHCALSLLQIEGAIHGVHSAGVQAAYMNVAKVLFKCSKSEGHDGDFLKEGLLEPLLEVLQSTAPECTSSDLRVYLVGVLKNISHNDGNQKFLIQQGAIATLFALTGIEQLTGTSKEAQLLIQITATLRNLATSPDSKDREEPKGQKAHRQFLQEDRLSALTRMMALFPGQLELLTNISRIFAKLTLHGSACEAIAKNDSHIRQMARTMSACGDSAPLVLRLGFVLGNLTARSDRLRIVFGFDCEGTTLVPQLLRRYWQKDRQLARVELETGKAAGAQEVEEVLVKLIRLLANIAISPSCGSVLASSSAVVDPLLDMLGAKRIVDSEELVLNVVSAVTNLLFYDVPSNLLTTEENKQLLCRLFRPLLLESYNEEALVETARALGNLSRHEDARRCIAEIRLDEIIVILLNHYSRDLVFYVCGALVNLATDSDCIARLTSVCPVAQKLGKLLIDIPDNDPALQLVAVKVLTNLSIHPSVQWPSEDSEILHGALTQMIASAEQLNGSTAEEEEAERQQMLELARVLLSNLSSAGGLDPGASGAAPSPEASPDGKSFVCQVDGCCRRFDTKEKLAAHVERRHSS